MTEYFRFDSKAGLVGAVEIRNLTVDDLSDVRYLQTTALKHQAGNALSDEEIENFVAHVYSRSYSDWLITQHVFTAWLNGELVATGGYSPSDDSGASVRLHSIFVSPMFPRMGLGRRMVLEVEDRERRSGYDTIAVRASLNAIEFFEKVGYRVASRGLGAFADTFELPVAFMRKSYRGLADPASVN